MKRDEIKAELAKCQNVVELIRTANALKQAGEKESTVNKLVTQFRKELLNKTSSIKRIQKVSIITEPLSKTSTIGFQVKFLEKPIVIYDGDNVVII